MKKLFKALCYVLLVTMLSNTVMMGVAEANAKHFLIGGAVGAGAAIALPMIAPAIGGVLGAAGSAVAGGAIAASGALAGLGATIGAGVLTVAASPFFIPAVCIGTGILVGKMIYDRSHGNNTIRLKNPLRKNNGQGLFAKLKGTINKSRARLVNNLPNTEVRDNQRLPSLKNQSEDATMTVQGANFKPERREDSAQAVALSRYQAAYDRYVMLLQNGKTADDVLVQKALKEYQDAYQSYRKSVEQ